MATEQVRKGQGTSHEPERGRPRPRPPAPSAFTPRTRPSRSGIPGSSLVSSSARNRRLSRNLPSKVGRAVPGAPGAAGEGPPAYCWRFMESLGRNGLSGIGVLSRAACRLEARAHKVCHEGRISLSCSDEGKALPRLIPCPIPLPQFPASSSPTPACRKPPPDRCPYAERDARNGPSTGMGPGSGVVERGQGIGQRNTVEGTRPDGDARAARCLPPGSGDHAGGAERQENEMHPSRAGDTPGLRRDRTRSLGGCFRAMNVSDMRRDYTRDELHRRDLKPDPFDQFELWFKQAARAG